MFYQDYNPLLQYHNLLRMSAASGYPNTQFASPHPYEMSMSAMRPTRYPFSYQRGRQMRMYAGAHGPQGVRPGMYGRGSGRSYGSGSLVTR